MRRTDVQRFAQGKILQTGPAGGVPQSALAPLPRNPDACLAMNARCISAPTTFAPLECLDAVYTRQVFAPHFHEEYVVNTLTAGAQATVTTAARMWPAWVRWC